MQGGQPAKLLRLHFSERDRCRGRPLYQAIVDKCRELKIAGATVLRGYEGYGESAEIHRRHLIGRDLPVVVTIIDSGENVERLLPVLEEMMDTGLIAISDVTVRRIQRPSGEKNV